MMDYRIFVFLLSIICYPLSACSQAPAPVTHYGSSKGAGSAGVHTVQRGDTVFSISKRYHIPAEVLMIENNISEPSRIQIGKRLNLPPPQTYTVKPGDSVASIARLFDVHPADLARLNHVPPPYRLYPRQQLKLPSGPVSAPSPTPTVAKTAPIQRAPVTSVQTAPLKPSQESAIVKPSQKPQAPVKTATPSYPMPKRSSAKFQKPVHGTLISSYGPKKDGLHNDGLNWAAPKGAPVIAAENGRVVYVGNDLKGTGNLVLIKHSDNWMSAYAHLDKSQVQNGQNISRGDQIGTVGKTGSVSTPQLHFELRRGTKALNPAVYIDK